MSLILKGSYAVVVGFVELEILLWEVEACSNDVSGLSLKHNMSFLNCMA